MKPKTLFTIFAIAEATTWALLLAGMFLKYVTQTTEVLTSIGGAVHGFVFIAYCLVAIIVGVDQRWSLGKHAIALLAAVPPFATIPMEIYARRKGWLSGPWTLRPGGRKPRHLLERVIAGSLAHPLPALLIGLGVVCALFGISLLVGPPFGG